MSDPILDTLSAAVVSTAPNVRGRAMYIGWSADGLPTATGRVAQLSAPARESLQAFRSSGLAVRKVPFSELIPVTYVMTGAAVDFADISGRVAEDHIRYSIIDAHGEKREVPIGELSLLRGIVLARHPWQAPGGGHLELAIEAVPLYSVFTGLPGSDDRGGLAMLFQPTLAGQTNEPAFRSFVRNSVGRLLVLDESQPPGRRRGYLEVAGRVAGVMPKSGMLGTLVSLRRMGFVDFDDVWLQGFRNRGRRVKGGFIRALRAVGMVEVDDSLLAELTDPRPDYDVDKLGIEQMIDMAEEMFHAARSRLG